MVKDRTEPGNAPKNRASTALVDDLVVAEEARVFVAPSNGSMRLYDGVERRWIRDVQLDGIDQPVALSRDGTRLLATAAWSPDTGTRPSTAMIDTTTGEELWRREGLVADTAVITGDRAVVTGGRITSQGTEELLVLDVETGEELAVSKRSWATSALAVSPDGSIPFDQASIADWAATTVTRNLSDNECLELLDRACAVRFDVP